jgi:hypothetical protein
MTGRSQPLLQWQRSLYDDNHTGRGTLLVHALTNPLFLLGNLALVTSPVTSLWAALAGLAMMAVAMAAQGKTHARERVAPVPFDGPLDAAARIFAEQWVTFPRFVMDGGFARAWRAAVRDEGR